MRQCGALLIDLSAYLATVRGGLGATGHESLLLPLTFPAVAAVVAAAIYLWRCCCRGWCCWRCCCCRWLQPACIRALAEQKSTSASAPALQCKSSLQLLLPQQRQQPAAAAAELRRGGWSCCCSGRGRGSAGAEPHWQERRRARAQGTPGRARRARGSGAVASRPGNGPGLGTDWSGEDE
jgi:hypothetical protein